MADDRSISPRRRSIALPGRGSGTMAFLDFGDPRRPVDAVFAHANGFNARTYRQVLGPLASHFRILAVDQRGHGSTSLETNLTDQRNWLDLRDDLLAFLAVLDLKGVVLSGHSMGATACLLAAAADTPTCRRLVLCDPVILPPDHFETPPTSPIVQSAGRRRAVFPSRAEALESYKGRGAFKTWPEAMLVDYVQDGFRDLPSGEVTLACAPGWEASGFAAHGHDSWRALRNTVCPIEILRAEVASTFNLGGVDTLDPTRIRIETLPGSTHFLPMEAPERIRSALSAAILADASAETRASSLASLAP
jgi:pimeloyl-ACP methyl ester carboxylesterase